MSNILDFIKLSSINPLSLHHINNLTTNKMNAFSRETQTLKDLKKVIDLMKKIEDSETFVGVFIDRDFYERASIAINEATCLYADELIEKMK